MISFEITVCSPPCPISVSSKVKALEGTGAETDVKSSYFRAETAYYKIAGPAGSFYRSAIQYLAYTPASSLPEARSLELAVDVSLAALVVCFMWRVFSFARFLSLSLSLCVCVCVCVLCSGSRIDTFFRSKN